MKEEEEEEAPAITRNKFDEILTLDNLYWFHHLILFKYPPTPTPTPTPIPPPPPPMALSSQPNRHRRTHSDGPISLNRPVKPPPLQIIPSRNYSLNIIQSSQLNSADMDAMKRRRPPKSPLRRSKSELELEELKGLMERGFKISDTQVERDSESTDIVPGLRKKRSEVKGKEKMKARRYSSDWSPKDDEERRRVLGDWSVLANGDERDVKDQLRQWAHVVASSRLYGASVEME